MPHLDTRLSLPRHLHSQPARLEQVVDAHGHIVADIEFFEPESVLYVRWHGHLTAAEIVRVATATLHWHEQLHPAYDLNDKRHCSGDWGESQAWIEYEWIPRVKASGLQAFAYVISPDASMSLDNNALMERISQSIPMRTFFDLAPAWKWLRQHALRHAGAAA